ncbi:MAG: hypothetical protein ACR2I2_14555 [Bryobacteraceae bacterium]
MEALQKDADENKTWADFCRQECERYEQANEELRREVSNLRARTETLLQAIKEGKPQPQVPTPDSLEDLEEWSRQLAGRVVFAPRAFSAAAKSDYSDPKLVYKSLLALSNEYWVMKHSGGREPWDHKLQELGVREEGAITLARAGQHEDEYFINHPLYPERRIFLSEHLAKGNSRDRRKCLRIYFTWDGQYEHVIVGWLPSHLTNKLS